LLTNRERRNEFRAVDFAAGFFVVVAHGDHA
jgi:hypothetical protein